MYTVFQIRDKTTRASIQAVKLFSRIPHGRIVRNNVIGIPIDEIRLFYTARNIFRNHVKKLLQTQKEKNSNIACTYLKLPRISTLRLYTGQEPRLRLLRIEALLGCFPGDAKKGKIENSLYGKYKKKERK